MVFVSENEASQHAVNLAVALARPEVDSVHVMHACTNEATIPDAQKLMTRLTQGLGSKINSEVMVSPIARFCHRQNSCIRCCALFVSEQLWLMGCLV